MTSFQTPGNPSAADVSTANNELEVFGRQEFGRKMGFGNRPALLIIDFTVGFADPEIFGGGNIGDAIAHTVPLLEAARIHGIPVVHTRIVYADDGSNAGVHCLKVPRAKRMTENSPLGQIVPALSPRPGEIVVRKRMPSAFFGSDLAGVLVSKGVDTVVIAGCTTSGCVRASTLDAMCYGFRPMVVEECVGDRALGPHHASLFDMGQKYADVISLHDATKEIERCARRSSPS